MTSRLGRQFSYTQTIFLDPYHRFRAKFEETLFCSGQEI